MCTSSLMVKEAGEALHMSSASWSLTQSQLCFQPFGVDSLGMLQLNLPYFPE